MYTLRTRFKKDILCEFLAPTKPQKLQKVIILASGMPGYPHKTELMFLLARSGYWVFNPRYRGTWESGGKFLQKSPAQDILDIINQLPQGFANVWDNTQYKVNPNKLYIFGSSFGGPSALLNSHDPRITKVVAISAVVDWQDPSSEPMDWLKTLIPQAFGEAYRFTNKDWKKLLHGNFYNPVYTPHLVDGNKTLFIHTKDDTVVRYEPVKKFVQQIGAQLITLPRGGHTGMSLLLKPPIWKKVSAFLKS